MSHTPGPWKTIFKPILTETQSPRAWRMFVTSEMGAVGASNGETVEEATANARLIAVAPDLLEALEPFAKFAEHWDAWHSAGLAGQDEDPLYTVRFVPGQPAVLITLGNLRAARAAIAKARGEA